MPAVELMDVPTTRLTDPQLRGNSRLLRVSRAEAAVARGARGEAISRVQAALRSLGYAVRSPAGLFDGEFSAVLRRFQRERHLEGTGVLDAATLLELDRALMGARGALQTLQTLSHERAEYAEAVARWPDRRPIWPELRTRAAQLAFLRFCLRSDETDREAYMGHFPNLCTGFAVQLYARLSDRAASLSEATRRNLARGPRVDCGGAPAKLRIPLFLVSSRGHMFNAVLVGDDLRSLASFVLIEPQQDALITRGSAAWQRHVERHGISLVDLAECDDQGRMPTQHVQGFVLGGGGEMVAVSSERATNFAKDLAIAESDAQEYAFMVPDGDFAAFVRRRAGAVWRLSEAELLEVGRLLRGRQLREGPGREAVPVTPARYAQWLGRLDLLDRL